MNWFEDEEFWREFFPVMFPEDRFAAAGAQVEQILKLTGVQSGAVLDLCCGPGRHSQEFAQRGFAVTGVDKSEFLLQQAMVRGTGPVEWVHQDMRDFRRERAFHLACNLFTSFGYFESDEDNLQVLRNVHASLKPGGVFVLEVLGKERLARIWKDSIVTDYPDGTTWVQRPQIRDDWCRVENEWLLVKGASASRFCFKHWIYSARELKDLLRLSGFAKVDVFGDLGGSPYGLDALRLVAVARRVSP
jgi:SAM-dependent methyltransferase